jgi:hypothetical protein
MVTVRLVGILGWLRPWISSLSSHKFKPEGRARKDEPDAVLSGFRLIVRYSLSS